MQKAKILILILLINPLFAGVLSSNLEGRNEVFVGAVPGVAVGYDARLQPEFYLGGAFIFIPDKDAAWIYHEKTMVEFHGVYHFYSPTGEFPLNLSVYLGAAAGDKAFLQGGMIGRYSYQKWDFILNIGYSPRAGLEANYQVKDHVRLFVAIFNSTGFIGTKFSF